SLQVPNTFSQVLHVVALLSRACEVFERVSEVEVVMEKGLDHVNRFEACDGLVVVWVVYPAQFLPSLRRVCATIPRTLPGTWKRMPPPSRSNRGTKTQPLMCFTCPTSSPYGSMSSPGVK